MKSEQNIIELVTIPVKKLTLEDYKIAAAALTASIGSEGCRFSIGAKAHEFTSSTNIRQCSSIRAYNYAYRFRRLSAHKRRRLLAHTTTSPEEAKPISNVIFHFGNDLELFGTFPSTENNGLTSIGDKAADLQKELRIRELNFQPQEFPSTTSGGYDFGNAASTPIFSFGGNKVWLSAHFLFIFTRLRYLGTIAIYVPECSEMEKARSGFVEGIATIQSIVNA